MLRRLAPILLAVLCLLAGCTVPELYPEGMNIACKDLQFTVPGDFADFSGEDYAKDADFMFGRKTLVFMGLAEPKNTLQETTLVAYTERVIKGNGISCTPEQNGDGYLFTYEKPVGDTVYTYTVATFEGSSNFWILQFYCPSENLQENQPEIQIILEGIRPLAG